MPDIPAAGQTPAHTSAPGLGPASPKARADYEAAVAAYVAAGGEESVQRVITAVFGLTRRLDLWYNRQLADLDLSSGEWVVLAQLAKADGGPLSPGELAKVAGIAPSSMTHRLDRMAARGLLDRNLDLSNRTRVQVYLRDAGWEVFEQAVREQNVVESDVLAGLSDRQRSDLGRLLELVITRLDSIDTA